MPQSLPSLPSLPRMPRKPRALVACQCGCDGLTRSRFVPGHDSRLLAWVLRIERGVVASAPAPHTAAAAAMVADRVASGMTGRAHAGVAAPAPVAPVAPAPALPSTSRKARKLAKRAAAKAAQADAVAAILAE